jgi:predicted ATP-dependent serine protease
MGGDQKAYKSAWWGARKYSPAGFTASVDDWMNAIDGEDPYEYTPTPIEAYNKLGKGLVKGGITVVKAPPGTGKSSYLRKLMHDLVVDKDKVVACLMMEEVKSVTGRAMATYQLGKNVKTKEDASFNGVSEDKVKEALKTVLGEGGERFISFDVNPQDPVEDTLKQCKHAITIYGAEYIFIDHLQRLAYLVGTESATSSLTELGVKLTELAKRRNVGIVCISHVNSEGRTKYASSIEEEAIVMIEMSRDKKSEDHQERNTTYLEITKNRPYALTGPAGMLTYDIETDMVTERLGPREPAPNNTEDF